MIPTYNPGRYLEGTLRSVLMQDGGAGDMQIEVVDDCSTKGDTERRVREIGGGRIGYFRQDTNGGLAKNWNTCISRARGECVHILHQDDMVLPGFYESLRNGLKLQSVGAAICRPAYIDDDGHWVMLGRIEERVPGVIGNWFERIASEQRVECAGVVVKRKVYEKVGGYRSDLKYALDWEMWIRIASQYEVYYEPKLLACYRYHGDSETHRLKKEGGMMEDIAKCIEVTGAYLGQQRSDEVTRQAWEWLAKQMMRRVGGSLDEGMVLEAECLLRGYENQVPGIARTPAVVAARGWIRRAKWRRIMEWFLKWRGGERNLAKRT